MKKKSITLIIPLLIVAFAFAVFALKERPTAQEEEPPQTPVTHDLPQPAVVDATTPKTPADPDVPTEPKDGWPLIEVWKSDGTIVRIGGEQSKYLVKML